jgi:hypothetical protein
MASTLNFAERSIFTANCQACFASDAAMHCFVLSTEFVDNFVGNAV